MHKTLDIRGASGRSLAADLYLPPRGEGPPPLLVGVHGGGWTRGSRESFAGWGGKLAAHGVGLLAIDYALATPERPSFPLAISDIAHALRHVADHAGEMCVDASRLGLFGLSAGAHLATLAALGRGDPELQTALGGDVAYLDRVRVVVAAYGIYDLPAHWNWCRARSDEIPGAELMIGASPAQDPKTWRLVSPLSHVHAAGGRPDFLLLYGTEDEVVDTGSQTLQLAEMLEQTGFAVSVVAVAGAGHFWMSAPMDEADSRPAQVLPEVIEFLHKRLYATG